MKKNLNRPQKLLAVLLMAMGLVTVAQAADVYVKEDSLGAGQQSGSLLLPVAGSAQDYFVGFQNVSVATDSSGTSATSFAAYCVDPAHFSSNSFNPYYSPSSASNVVAVFSGQATDIQNLYNKYYAGTIGNNANAAAFQLALWEIANDNQNLNTGLVQVNGSTNSTLVANAGALLGDLNYSGPNLYDLTVYQVDREAPANGIGQDYIVATSVYPVPEPESYGMLLGGLALIGFLARRRSGLC